MSNLGVKYMGLSLRSPIVAGSSGLSKDVDGVKRLVDAGAGAVVLKSVFEEQVSHDVRMMNGPDSTVPVHPEAEAYINTYGTEHAADKYLSLIEKARVAVDVPVIASLHCASDGQWVEYARKVRDAGASALELNVFIPPHDPDVNGIQLESVYLNIARKVKAAVDLPIAMKVGWHFSAMARFLTELSEHVDSLVLFNRFYRMTIDVEGMRLMHAIPFSEPREHEIPMRWISVMNGVARCDLAASTGVHDWQTAVRMMLVGASAVQVCSVLYREGPDSVTAINTGIADWMDRHGYDDIEQFRGSMSRRALKRPPQFDRVQFMKFSVGGPDSGID